MVESMRKNGYTLGGEQSGHLIFLDHSTTGDGSLAALQILSVMLQEERPLSELSAIMEKVPQVLVNVRVKQKKPMETLPEVQSAVAQVERALGKEGRVLVRYSGTEPKVRVMVEGADRARIDEYARNIGEVFQRELGEG